MCQTALISDKIVKLGARSYEQNMYAAAGFNYSVKKLARLNKSLDDFYEFLYEQFNSISDKDYRIFKPQLSILLKTLKSLYDTCLKLPKSWGFQEETEKLGLNYSALFEIDSDLRNFRSLRPQSTEMRNLLSQAAHAFTTISSN